MAKISNEAKLILTLATERMREHLHAVQKELQKGDYREGYHDAYHAWLRTLQDIELTLEAE